jgi:signal transduction histidine kinase
MALEPDANPEVEALLRQNRERPPSPLAGRQLVVEGLLGVALLAVVLPLLAGTDVRAADGPLAVALVAAYAVASRIKLELPAGVTDPTLLVVVPMLLLLPPALVPLLVAAGLALGDLPDVVAGRMHPSRLLLGLSNAWFAVGPAIVLTVAGVEGPDLADWPVLLLALAALLAGDFVVSTVAEALAHNVRSQILVRVQLQIWTLDVLLAPVGLLVALACAQNLYAWLLVLPLFLVLAGLAREREGRLSNALALAASRAETLASISHGLQRPVASVVGFSSILQRAGLDGAPGLAARQLDRDAHELRHRLRQALDYIALRAGRDLTVAPARDVDVAELLAEVAGRHDGRVALACDGPLPARTDRERLLQVLVNLADNAVATGAPVRLAARRAADGAVEVELADEGPGPPEEVLADPWAERPREAGAHEATGAGIGLFVTGAIARRLGLEVALRRATAGTVATVRIPPGT